MHGTDGQTGRRHAHCSITALCVASRGKKQCFYLLIDIDEQDEDDENEQVVKDTDCSDDDVDDLECKVRWPWEQGQMTLSARSRMLARYDVRSSDSDGDVVTSFQTSLVNDAFSIAAECRLSHQPQQPVIILSY